VLYRRDRRSGVAETVHQVEEFCNGGACACQVFWDYFGEDRRCMVPDCGREALQGATLKSFHVDLDYHRPVRWGVTKKVITTSYGYAVARNYRRLVSRRRE